MSFDLQLQGKRALVSGGTKGVGAAVVRALHAADVQVMTTARSLSRRAMLAVALGCPRLGDVVGLAFVDSPPFVLGYLGIEVEAALDIAEQTES